MKNKVLLQTVLMIVLLTVSSLSAAHEIRPAFLSISDVSPETGPATFQVLWRVPNSGEGIPLTIFPIFPEHCKNSSDVLEWQDGIVKASKWSIRCPGGLAGSEIEIGDLDAAVTDVLAQFKRSDGTTQIARVTPTSTRFTVTESESWLEVASTYTSLGVEHILFGIDHLLFVLALLMIVPGRRMLIMTITSFTVAHSLTLAASTLGWAHIPQKPVEAVIALSIMFVAMEIVHWREGRPGLTRRKPWIVAFVFGLLHGFGFAGALFEIGLPENAIPLSLLFFNVGVEIGQLIFVGFVLLAWAILKRFTIPEWSWRLAAYAIGTVAAFWTIERISGFQGL